MNIHIVLAMVHDSTYIFLNNKRFINLAVMTLPLYFVYFVSNLDIQRGTIVFQEYYLIMLLIAALLLAALVHPKETWLIVHGFSYLLGFPAMQILLPIYAICNIVDQSWGTRDTVSLQKYKTDQGT